MHHPLTQVAVMVRPVLDHELTPKRDGSMPQDIIVVMPPAMVRAVMHRGSGQAQRGKLILREAQGRYDDMYRGFQVISARTQLAVTL